MVYYPEDESVDAYLRYAAKFKGIPDEFDDWAAENKIRLSKKKKQPKDYEEEQE